MFNIATLLLEIFKDKTVAQIFMSISCGELDHSIHIWIFDPKIWIKIGPTTNFQRESPEGVAEKPHCCNADINLQGTCLSMMFMMMLLNVSQFSEISQFAHVSMKFSQREALHEFPPTPTFLYR